MVLGVDSLLAGEAFVKVISLEVVFAIDHRGIMVTHDSICLVLVCTLLFPLLAVVSSSFEQSLV